MIRPDRRRFATGLAAAPLCALLGAPAARAAGELAIRRVPYPHGLEPPRGAVSYREPETPGAERRTLEVEGRRRTYHLYAPGAASGPRPAILLLHGARRTGRSMIDMFRGVAEAHGTALVAPDSLGPSWSPRDDGPGALLALLRDAAMRTPLDASRLHLFGHSAGAILATLHANRVPGLWRAVVTHGGVLDAASVTAAAQPAAPIRAYLGARDHLFPVSGAQAMARALSAAGHRTELVVIEGHTHWFYGIGPRLAEEAHAFMEAA